jgi:cell division protein ZapA (FtsZ GTPase activity inhibitor)
MNEPYYDDFNSIESVSVEDHYNELQYLEDKVNELEQVNQEMREDEIFVLAEIMLIRDHYSDYQDVKEELDHVIKMHDKTVREKAQEKLMAMYPNRHWGEDLWRLG